MVACRLHWIVAYRHCSQSVISIMTGMLWPIYQRVPVCVCVCLLRMYNIISLYACEWLQVPQGFSLCWSQSVPLVVDLFLSVSAALSLRSSSPPSPPVLHIPLFSLACLSSFEGFLSLNGISISFHLSSPFLLPSSCPQIVLDCSPGESCCRAHSVYNWSKSGFCPVNFLCRFWLSSTTQSSTHCWNRSLPSMLTSSYLLAPHTCTAVYSVQMYSACLKGWTYFLYCLSTDLSCGQGKRFHPH